MKKLTKTFEIRNKKLSVDFCPNQKYFIYYKKNNFELHSNIAACKDVDDFRKQVIAMIRNEDCFSNIEDCFEIGQTAIDFYEWTYEFFDNFEQLVLNVNNYELILAACRSSIDVMPVSI